MGLLISIVILSSIIIFVVHKWVEGITYMDKHHPDYKGNDLFGENDDEKEKDI